MKKTITLGFLSLFLISLFSIFAIAENACFPPYSVFGKYNYYGYADGTIRVSVFDARYGQTYYTEGGINEFGEYSLDLGNIPTCYYKGMNAVLEILNCNSADCKVNFVVAGDNFKHDFIFGGIQGYYCWDGSTAPTLAECPSQPTPEPTQIEEENKLTSVDGESAYIEAYYGQSINIEIKNNKISKLIDAEIEFNGEKYEVEESILFKGIAKTSIDNEDFGLLPYVQIKENEIEYRYTFGDLITLSEISEDEPLEITFLGRDIKIIEANSNSVKVRSGIEKVLNEGESIAIGNKIVTVKTVGENSVSIDVSGTTKIIGEGNSKEINYINILVDDILYKSYAGASSAVVLLIGTETDKTIKNGDDFELFKEDDETWEWVVSLGTTEQFIGIKNKESYLGIDEDDDYKALGLGETFTLPNNYMEINYKSISTVDENELSFKVKDNYLYVKGDENVFSYGTKEYGKLYVNSVGIYDEDKVLITNTKVKIGDSDIYLELGSVKIGDLTIKFDMSDILYKGISFATRDSSFLDYLGIKFYNPENAIEDKEGFKVVVPDERPEITLTFKIGEFGLEVPISIVPKPEEPVPVEPTTTIPIEVPIKPEPVVTTATFPPESIEKVIIKCEDGSVVQNIEDCPEGGINWLLDAFIAIITLALGVLGYKYKWLKGLTAMWKKKAGQANTTEKKKEIIKSGTKAIKTVFQKDKEGKYNK